MYISIGRSWCGKCFNNNRKSEENSNKLLEKIYIERMLKNTNILMQQINWARILLGAVVLASKVWDDHAIWNIDFTQIFPEILVSDLYEIFLCRLNFFRNELENFYLHALEYNVNVKPGNYAKVYFELREICAFHSMFWALDPLKQSETSRIQVIQLLLF